MAKNKNNFTFYSQDWQSSQTLLGTTPEERAIYFELIIKAHQEDNEIVEDLNVWSRSWNIKKRRLLSVLSQLVKKKMIEKRGKTWYVPSVQRRIKARIKGLESYNKKLEKQNNLKATLEGGGSTQDIRNKIEDINNKIKDIPKEDVVEEVSNVDGSKWYDWFCKSWNLNSLEHKKKKSYLRSLTKSAQDSLKVILKDFTQEDVKKAMVGLMIQKSFPNQQELANDPTHLLKDDGVFISKYIGAYDSVDREIYGKIKKFE